MTNFAEFQMRTATDSDFRAALLADPRGTLAKEGVELPEGLAIRVEESTPTELVIALPPVLPDGVELDEDALAGTAGGVTPFAGVAAAIVYGVGAVASGGIGFALGRLTD